MEFEVDQNRSNRLWTVRLYDDGIQVFTGLRRTVAPSGSFSVTRRIAEPGRHRPILGRAVNATTGEVCRARVNV